MRDQDADEQRDDDHHDQGDFVRAEDPVDLDFFDVEHREQCDQDREHRDRCGPRELATAASLPGRLGWLCARWSGHAELILPTGQAPATGNRARIGERDGEHHHRVQQGSEDLQTSMARDRHRGRRDWRLGAERLWIRHDNDRFSAPHSTGSLELATDRSRPPHEHSGDRRSFAAAQPACGDTVQRLQPSQRTGARVYPAVWLQRRAE